MKKLCCLVLAGCMLLLCGCSTLVSFQERITREARGTTTVSIILCQDSSPLAQNLQQYLTDSEQATYVYFTASDAADQYDIVCQQAKLEGTALIAVDLSATTYAGKMIAAAQEQDLPIIFLGVKPALGIMNRYDKCWYIGFDRNLAVEEQGTLLVSQYRNKQLNDLDGDFQLGTLAVQTNESFGFLPYSYGSDIVGKLTLGGVSAFRVAESIYGQDADTLQAKLEELLLPMLITNAAEPEPDPADTKDELPEDAQEETEQAEPVEYWVAPQLQPEVLICGDAAASHAALAVRDEMAAAAANPELVDIANPNTDLYIICFGDTEEINTALREGRILGSVAEDWDALALALQAFCNNILAQQTPTLNTNYYLTQSKYLMLDYIVLK